MKKTTTLFSAIALLSLNAFAWGQHEHDRHHTTKPAAKAGAQHQGMHEMPMGMKGMETLRNLSGRSFDIAFLSQMIEHHRGGVEMAREELATGERSDVKAIARKIVSGQTREIQAMVNLLEKTYKTQPSEKQMNLLKEDSKSMMAMKITNDTLFLDMMTQHHQHAIEMSGLALQKAQGTQVKKLAHKFLTDQKKDNTRMTKLRQKVSAGVR